MSRRLAALAHRQPLTTGEGSLIERARYRLEASKRYAAQGDERTAMTIAQETLADVIRELEAFAR